MNLQFYLEKLHSSEDFRKFKKENPDAFLCSCFFSIDAENKNIMKKSNEKSHLDYYSPSGKNKGKKFSFQLEDGIKIVPLENFSNEGADYIPEKIRANSELNFNEIEKIISDEMSLKNINNKIQKILISLQNKDGKDFWICTVFLSGLGLLKVNIDDSKKTITEFEKKSFFDMLSITGKKK